MLKVLAIAGLVLFTAVAPAASMGIAMGKAVHDWVEFESDAAIGGGFYLVEDEGG